MPDQEQVRMIFKETYLLYAKYIKQDSIDWDAFHAEYSSLCRKYPFKMTVDIVEDIVQIIGNGKGGM